MKTMWCGQKLQDKRVSSAAVSKVNCHHVKPEEAQPSHLAEYVSTLLF